MQHTSELGQSEDEISDSQAARFIVGRSLDCDILVSSPRVSARHAELRVNGHAGWVRDLGSRYGTTINNSPVTNWTSFGPDDRVMVGNSELVIEGNSRIGINPARSGAVVCAAGLGVAVNRGKKQLLHSVSFVVEPGEFVALMGLSGAGKSTLLKTIVGINAPSWGSVLINGVDIAKDPTRARMSVGYVPQDDIVHSDLTVREALRYGATMRLPLDTNKDQIESRIAVVMNDLGISHIADTIIGSAERQGISGGQRKRVNLALELLPQPPLLLLDEPTSGLSSEDATNVFLLLRQLADDGHTIIVTTHQPSLADFKRFDRVIYLSDGELVYFGPAWPDSATYFVSSDQEGNVGATANAGDDAGAALAKLSELKRAGVTARTLAQRYEQSSYFSKYVAQRLGALQLDTVGKLRQKIMQPRDSLQQLRNQISRYARLKLRNRGSLPIQLAQAPSVAILVNVVFNSSGGADPKLSLPSIIFFMTIAAVWFGCSNAAREIVGERAILMRERMVGLGIAPYMLSKLSVLGILSAVQCLILIGITYAWRGLDGLLWQQFGIMWMCSMLGVLMGLTLSAIMRSSEAALSATPLILIPEILLSGFIMPLDSLQLITRALSNFTVTRWGFESLLKSEHLHAAASHHFGSHAVGLLPAAGYLVGLALLYCCVLILSLAGNPRRFA
jgi:ABC-type multidrug transport system ATPase subunit